MASSAFACVRSPSLTRVVGVGGDEAGILQADQREEQAYACGNAELEIERYGVDQPFAYRRHRDQQEQRAGEEHDAKRELPIAAELRHHGEGEIGVEPHAGGKRDGVVGVEPHDGGRERRGEAGGDEHRAMIHAGLLEDRRVDEHDVGHGEEGGEAGPELGRHARCLRRSGRRCGRACPRARMALARVAFRDPLPCLLAIRRPRTLVIARLDRAIQYSLANLCLLDARLRGHDNVK